MQKWEYKVKLMVRGDIIKSMLDVLGEKGWELISCEGEMQANYYQLIFKRPVELSVGDPIVSTEADLNLIKQYIDRYTSEAASEGARK